MQNHGLKLKAVSGLAVAALIVALTILIWRPREAADSAPLEAFARCLTDKGAVMYGAYWCSHCQNEKKAFGKSFEFINYVECTEKPDLCTAASIAGYPTWIFPDGRRLEGEQGLKRLAEASGCALPN